MERLEEDQKEKVENLEEEDPKVGWCQPWSQFRVSGRKLWPQTGDVVETWWLVATS